MGLIAPEPGFHSSLRKITKENDILLIFDEVVTGFRMAPGGAQQYYNIKPDITTLGKALGNGFPISAVGGKGEIMDLLAPNGGVYQASTFAGNPVSVQLPSVQLKPLTESKTGCTKNLKRSTSHSVLPWMMWQLTCAFRTGSTTSHQCFRYFLPRNPVTNIIHQRVPMLQNSKKCSGFYWTGGVYCPVTV